MLNLGCRTEKCLDFYRHVVGYYIAPGKYETYQSVRVLKDKLLKENRKNAEVISWAVKLEPRVVSIIIGLMRQSALIQKVR